MIFQIWQMDVEVTISILMDLTQIHSILPVWSTITATVVWVNYEKHDYVTDMHISVHVYLRYTCWL